jgi:hypothetical protein
MKPKDSINNLLIVWKGQSWSVLTPTGEVLGRFQQKVRAADFAALIFDFVDPDDLIDPYTGKRKMRPQAKAEQGGLLKQFWASLAKLPDSANNLNVIWQGQSWQVIAPDGVVLGRFKDKRHAMLYAANVRDYVALTHDAEKPKRGE